MTAHSPAAALDATLAETVERLSGLRLDGTRLPASQRAIQRAMAAAGVTHPDDYRLLLERDRSAFEALLGSLTVGETFFFRERSQLELLRDVILPDLVSRHGRARAVQAWSAGCSTGEEAYSLAMVFAEGGVEARVLGTDVSPSRLAKAKAAVYGAWSLRGVVPGELDRYFEPVGKDYRVRPSLAERVAFAPASLVDGPPSRSRFDVVFCRNVLIYLTPDAMREAVSTLTRSLSTGGWLVLASSDPHLANSADLERVGTPHGVAYRRRGRHGAQLQAVARGDERRELQASPAGRAWSDRVDPPSPLPTTFAELGDESGVVATAETCEPDAAARAAAPQPPEPGAVEEWAAQIRELADRGRIADALERSDAALRAHATAAELHYLRALLSLGAGRLADALASADSALYLRADLALAHVLRAQVTRRLGDQASCERNLRNARRLLATLPPDAPVPMGDGERVDVLLAAIDIQLGAREP